MASCGRPVSELLGRLTRTFKSRFCCRIVEATSPWTEAVTALLMSIGFVVTFGVTYFARALNGIVFGWPFSFWVAAQGALIVFLLLICLYARWMARLDAEHGLGEDD